jgi:multicomponent Na+:H+ antiporter subunit F
MTGVLTATVGLLAIGALLSTIALTRTRVTMEKMVALDVLTTIMTGLLLVASLFLRSSFILDIAIVYAILSFGAVMVVARYREGGL